MLVTANERLKEQLAPIVARLGAALITTAREEKEAEQTQKTKNRAIAAYDDVFSKSASLISALLGVAGEEELARRVRPTKNKPGQISDPDVEVPGETATG